MDLEFLIKILPILLKGSIMTVQLTVLSVFIGSVIGIIFALMKISNNVFISKIATFYTWIFRGTPLLLQLFVFYYGLPVVGIKLEPFSAALLGLSLNSGAYMAEIIRGGIISINKGQFEACKAMGFTYFQTMKRVILPQTFKNIIPAVGNEFITILKDTSLVQAIAMEELMRSAQLRVSATGRPWEPYLVAGCLYLFMTTIFTVIFSGIEKKLSVY
ncbi:amino acid ABC transporter permease [Clostridium sediminicola]|uniref:amino acid ABC transporter permease n=1 Tax=Clostridium sediminicola TaxID=3114879 RepID=UPI0031F1E526